MIHVLVGTRAQLIKMAPVLQEIERRGLALNLVFTGQHRVTMQALLDDFHIATRPRYLYEGAEVEGIVHMGTWFLRCLWRLARRQAFWFPAARKAVVVVHGDTVSTLLGAVAGKLAGIPVAHVEAGLRSFRWLHPFPEEITRLAVFRLADIAYCPGAWASTNLAGYRLRRVDCGHNTLRDAVQWALEGRAPAPQVGEAYFVASIHRFENVFTRPRLAQILAILERLMARARCVFVLHPVTESRLRRFGLLEAFAANPRVELRPRMDYTAFVALLAQARFVVTDGGSNQEELSYLGIPTVLLRAATERQEGLGGTALVSNYDLAAIDAFLDAARPAQSASALRAEPSPSRVIVDDLQALVEAPIGSAATQA